MNETTDGPTERRHRPTTEARRTRRLRRLSRCFPLSFSVTPWFLQSAHLCSRRKTKRLPSERTGAFAAVLPPSCARSSRMRASASHELGPVTGASGRAYLGHRPFCLRLRSAVGSSCAAAFHLPRLSGSQGSAYSSPSSSLRIQMCCRLYAACAGVSKSALIGTRRGCPGHVNLPSLPQIGPGRDKRLSLPQDDTFCIVHGKPLGFSQDG